MSAKCHKRTFDATLRVRVLKTEPSEAMGRIQVLIEYFRYAGG
jgi:hypothetical protein